MNIKDAAILGWNACRQSILAACGEMQEVPYWGGPLGPSYETERQAAHTDGFNSGYKFAAATIARGFIAMEAKYDESLRTALSNETQPEANGCHDAMAIIDAVRLTVRNTASVLDGEPRTRLEGVISEEQLDQLHDAIIAMVMSEPGTREQP